MQQASAQRDIIDMMKSLNEIILKEGKKLDWSSFQSDVAVLREQDSTWYRGRIFEDSDDLRKTSGDCPLVFHFEFLFEAHCAGKVIKWRQILRASPWLLTAHSAILQTSTVVTFVRFITNHKMTLNVSMRSEGKL